MDDFSSMPALHPDERQATSPEIRFREVFEQAPISMQLIASSGRTLQVNKAWKTLWQGTFGDGLLQLVLEGDYNVLTDPQLREKGITPYFERAFAGESVAIPAILYDPRLLGIPSQPRWVKAMAHPIRNAAGEVAEVMLMHEDITEQRKAEELLRANERRLRFVLDSMHQKIFTTTPEGNVDYFNPAWTEFTGLTFEDIRDWGWVQFIHPDDVDENLRRWRHSIDTGEPFELEHRFRRHDGQYRWHLSRAVPMRDDAGHVVMWIGSNTDIHEVKSAESEMARLNDSLQDQHRRKDEFLAMLAHELRNPLAPIRAAADLLSIAHLSEVRVRQTSDVISRQVQHMSSLVDDLLDVSRVTRGLIELELADLDIKRIVSDAVEQVRPLVEAKRHELTVQLSAEPAHVMGDHKRLVQILANLLNNAAKYTAHGGSIHVRTETTDQQVILTVQDNGIGIGKDLMPYVFELFAQAQRSADRSQGGLGIGLALVKSLVELHAGEVRCDSEGEGRGSRFVVRLPRLLAQQREPYGQHGRSLPVEPARKRRVLIVDDNVDAAEMLGMFMELAGHDIKTEHRAADAIRCARAWQPDVCILDIGLPDMDGNALARALRSMPETARARLIAVTGYGRRQDQESAEAAGFNHHLVKPVDTTTLMELLNLADPL